MSDLDEVKQISPWYSSAEWRHVFEMIYNPQLDSSSRYEALDTMKMWKTRTPYLAGGIEGTIEILEALLYDEQSLKSNKQNCRDIQVAYSMAIMRFLNTIVDTTRYNTMYHTAQNLQIPSWLISLRHEVAHSTKLPSLVILRKAAEYALNWLYEMYWKLENENMLDCVVNENACSAKEYNYHQYLDRYLIIYDNLVLYMSEYRFRRISDISIVKMKRELVMDINTFLMTPNTFVHEQCYLKSLLFMVVKRINEIVKRFKDTEKCAEFYVDSLLNCNLFMNSNILPEVNQYNRDFVKFWTPLLDHMHVTVGLKCLVKRLMDVSCHSKQSEKQNIACAWIEFILKAIAKTKAVQKITETNYINPPSVKRAIIEVNADSPQLKSPITFRPDVPIDSFFTSLEALQYALLNNAGVPNGKYWKILLLLMNKELPQEDIMNLDNLQNLVNNIVTNDEVSAKPIHTENQIYTADDLKAAYKDLEATEDGQSNANFIKIVAVNGSAECHNISSNRTWKEAPDVEDWKTCGIGLLPQSLESVQ